MRYGFAIDQRTCIGCHACTVACKTEHEVPGRAVPDLGEVRRPGACSRTTPATSASCAATTAPTRRAWRSARRRRCSNATTASSTSTATAASAARAACRAARTTRSTSTTTPTPPPSATSAPTASTTTWSPRAWWSARPHSIWVGDLDDPDSGISKLVNTNPVTVRAPEQNTGPNVFYLGADRAVLNPLAAPVDSQLHVLQPRPAPRRGRSRSAGRPGQPRAHHDEHRAPAAVGLAGHDLPVDQGRSAAVRWSSPRSPCCWASTSAC